MDNYDDVEHEIKAEFHDRYTDEYLLFSENDERIRDNLREYLFAAFAHGWLARSNYHE